MAGSKSDFMEKVVLDLFLGGKPFTPPPALYLALSTAAYSETATGLAMAEVPATDAGGASTGYGRRATSNDFMDWPEAVKNGAGQTVKSNGAPFTFATATAAWGTIVSFYVCDAATGGNVLYGGDLSVAKQILTGDTATFSLGSIQVTED